MTYRTPRRRLLLFAVLAALLLVKIIRVTQSYPDNRPVEHGMRPDAMLLKDAAGLVAFSAGICGRMPGGSLGTNLISESIEPTSGGNTPGERSQGRVVVCYEIINKSINMNLSFKEYGNSFSAIEMVIFHEGRVLPRLRSARCPPLMGNVSFVGPGETYRWRVVLNSEFDMTAEGDYTVDVAMPLKASVGTHIEQESWTFRASGLRVHVGRDHGGKSHIEASEHQQNASN